MMQDERKFKGGMWDGQELAGSRKFVCLILAKVGTAKVVNIYVSLGLESLM